MTEDELVDLADKVNAASRLLEPVEQKLLEALGAAALVDTEAAARATQLLREQVGTIRRLGDELSEWLWPDDGPKPGARILPLHRDSPEPPA